MDLRKCRYLLIPGSSVVPPMPIADASDLQCFDFAFLCFFQLVADEVRGHLVVGLSSFLQFCSDRASLRSSPSTLHLSLLGRC